MQKLMIQKLMPFIVIVVLLGLVLLYASTYTVGQAQTALKFRLGEIVQADIPPGLHFKWPIINNVITFDARVQTLDEAPQRLLTVEQKNLIVDAFMKWRIDNVGKYYTTVGGSSESANLRLSEILKDGLRVEFGKRNINELIAGDRVKIMDILQRETDKVAESLGVEVVDVRIKRIDLPDEVSESVYARMSAERARAARRYRAEGKEAAERIKAEADRRQQIILANAHRDALKIRGQGDAQAADIYIEAHSRHPDFYSFYRSLAAYRDAFDRKDDLFVLSTDSEFFQYFNLDEKKH